MLIHARKCHGAPSFGEVLAGAHQRSSLVSKRVHCMMKTTDWLQFPARARMIDSPRVFIYNRSLSTHETPLREGEICYSLVRGRPLRLDAAKDQIATPPFRERSLGRQDRGQRLQLVAFRRKDRFGIGAGNFADRNPADATNQRAD
jgi:hypothetical protein